MRKVAVSNVFMIFLALLCLVLFSASAIFAYNLNIKAYLTFTQELEYSCAIAYSKDNSTYYYFYDNTDTNTLTTTNLTISPEQNNKIVFSATFSNLASTIYFKIINYTTDITLKAQITSLEVYGRSASVAGYSSITSAYNTLSSAMTVALPTTLESPDTVEIQIQISENS